MRNKKGFIVTSLIILGSITLLGAFSFIFLLYFFNNELDEKIKSKKFLEPTIYYAGSINFKVGEQIDLDLVKKSLLTFRERHFDQPILAEDYFFTQGQECAQFIRPIQTNDNPQSTSNLDSIHCFGVHWPKLHHPHFENEHFDVVVFSSTNNTIQSILSDATPSTQVSLSDSTTNSTTDSVSDSASNTTSHSNSTPDATTSNQSLKVSEDFYLPPKIIAQYLGEEPILYSQQSLNTYPTHCLNAILAIEDAKFLEHKGVSITGIARAIFKNLILQKKAQGGSTITQQLVKNYFLSSEKTLKRKFQEFFMAIMLETKFEKDLILETYLNVIYMGQKGSYQIRGYGAASEYYFSKPVSDLNLHECSLMAAIVNSPGLFNPFTKPEKSKERRSLVLKKMVENNFITENEEALAINAPLPQIEPTENISSIPYFIQSVQFQLKKFGFDNFEGLSIYTTVQLEPQKIAQESIQYHLNFLESNHKVIQKNLSQQNKKLESLLISVDVNTSQILSLVGGRSYKSSQFNRAINSQRQVGSTFKPIVYLTALMNDYDPLSVVHDTPFIFKEKNQKWEPQNYSKTWLGDVPLFYALKESLNLPTAKLAIDLGIDKVIDTAEDLGVDTDLPAVPSLSLGSFGISPINMTQVYLNIARLGQIQKLTNLVQVQDKNKTPIWKFEPENSEFKNKAAIQVLVGILKETVRTGTAQQISKSGFIIPAAGKTGTTNDNKDSWFVGFTPETLTLVWTGYDDNTPTGLTGANGAVPIWLNYMKKTQVKYESRYSPTASIALSTLTSTSISVSKSNPTIQGGSSTNNNSESSSDTSPNSSSDTSSNSFQDSAYDEQAAAIESSKSADENKINPSATTDFKWNFEEVEKKIISEDDLIEREVRPKDNKPFPNTELIFQK